MRIRDPGWRQFGSGIRDGKKSDPGSGIYIPDHYTAHTHYVILVILLYFFTRFTIEVASSFLYNRLALNLKQKNIPKKTKTTLRVLVPIPFLRMWTYMYWPILASMQQLQAKEGSKRLPSITYKVHTRLTSNKFPTKKNKNTLNAGINGWAQRKCHGQFYLIKIVYVSLIKEKRYRTKIYTFILPQYLNPKKYFRSLLSILPAIC
jgi:hypothetical protein